MCINMFMEIKKAKNLQMFWISHDFIYFSDSFLGYVVPKSIHFNQIFY